MYVYIMYCGGAAHPRSKVGISANPEARLRHLQRSSAFGVRLVQAWDVGSKEVALQVESEVHKRLKDRRVRGEWFKCQEHIAMHALHDVLRERGLMRPWPSQVHAETR